MDERRHRMIAMGMVVVGVLLIFGYRFYDELTRPDIPVVEVPIQSRDHVPPEQVNLHPDVYSTHPPTSGPHVVDLADADLYDQRLPLGLLVHNLEHSHVVIYYSVERASDETLADLEELTQTHTGTWDSVIAVPLEPYEFEIEGEPEVILTAWGAMMHLDEYRGDYVREFLRRYLDLGHH